MTELTTQPRFEDIKKIESDDPVSADLMNLLHTQLGNRDTYLNLAIDMALAKIKATADFVDDPRNPTVDITFDSLFPELAEVLKAASPKDRKTTPKALLGTDDTGILKLLNQADVIPKVDTDAIAKNIAGNADFQKSIGDSVKANPDFRKDLGNALKSDADFRKGVSDTLKSDGDFNKAISENIKGDTAFKKSLGDDIKGDADFKKGVGDSLKSDTTFKKELGDAIRNDSDFKKGVADSVKGDASLKKELADAIKSDTDFKKGVGDALKSDTGFTKGVGDTLKGDSGFKKELGDAIKSDSDFKKGVGDALKADADFKKGVGDTLKGDSGFKKELGDAIKSDSDFKKGVGDALKADSNFTKGVGNSLKNDADFTKGISDTVGTAIAGDTSFKDKLANDPNFQNSVGNAIKNSVADSAAEKLREDQLFKDAIFNSVRDALQGDIENKVNDAVKIKAKELETAAKRGIDAVNSKVDLMSQELSRANQRIRTLEGMKTQLTTAQQDLTKLRTDLSDLKDKVDDIDAKTAEVGELKTTTDFLKTEYRNMDQRLSDFSSDFGNNLNTVKGSVQTLDGKVKTLEKDVAKLKNPQTDPASSNYLKIEEFDKFKVSNTEKINSLQSALNDKALATDLSAAIDRVTKVDERVATLEKNGSNSSTTVSKQDFDNFKDSTNKELSTVKESMKEVASKKDLEAAKKALALHTAVLAEQVISPEGKGMGRIWQKENEWQPRLFSKAYGGATGDGFLTLPDGFSYPLKPEDKKNVTSFFLKDGIYLVMGYTMSVQTFSTQCRLIRKSTGQMWHGSSQVGANEMLWKDSSKSFPYFWAENTLFFDVIFADSQQSQPKFGEAQGEDPAKGAEFSFQMNLTMIEPSRAKSFAAGMGCIHGGYDEFSKLVIIKIG